MLKSLILKIFVKTGLSVFSKNNKINAQEVKTVLINRTDKLGDAVISLPFILELNKRFDVTVLTSQYNDFILREFVKTKIFIEKQPVLSDLIKLTLRNLLLLRFPVKKGSQQPQYDLYIDLIGIRGLNIFLKVKKRNLCRYYIGFNMFIWSLILDYAYKGSVEYTKTQMTEAYIKFIRESLGLNMDIPDYIELSAKMKKPENFDINSPYILVNISGFNNFRGPSAQTYAEVINDLDFCGTIMIMDELNQPNFPDFKKYVQRDNLYFLENNYSVWGLLYIAFQSLLYIGAGSGITHILQIPTNAIIFFANESYSVWKPYSKNIYAKRHAGKLIIEETRNSAGFNKTIIYSPVWCRPCFDIGCRNHRCITNMSKDEIVKEINNALFNV